MIPSIGPGSMPLSCSAFCIAFTCSAPPPSFMPMPAFEVPAVLPEAGVLPAPGVLVPACPVPGVDLAFPVVPVPEPVLGDGDVLGCVVEVLGWVAEGAALGALPEPVDGVLP